MGRRDHHHHIVGLVGLSREVGADREESREDKLSPKPTPPTIGFHVKLRPIHEQVKKYSDCINQTAVFWVWSVLYTSSFVALSQTTLYISVGRYLVRRYVTKGTIYLWVGQPLDKMFLVYRTNEYVGPQCAKVRRKKFRLNVIFLCIMLSIKRSLNAVCNQELFVVFGQAIVQLFKPLFRSENLNKYYHADSNLSYSINHLA